MKRSGPYLIIVILLVLTIVLVLFFGQTFGAHAQTGQPLADGVCGPIPAVWVTTIRPFVARTAPFTQAPGLGREIPTGTSFPVVIIVCDEGVTFVAIQWDDAIRWLPDMWSSGGTVWSASLPRTSVPVQSITATSQPAVNCPAALSSELVVGATGYNNAEFGDTNVRENAASPVITDRLTGAEEFTIIGGPRCVRASDGQNILWWHIRLDGDIGTEEGWVPEGRPEARWLLPGNSSN